MLPTIDDVEIYRTITSAMHRQTGPTGSRMILLLYREGYQDPIQGFPPDLIARLESYFWKAWRRTPPVPEIPEPPNPYVMPPSKVPSLEQLSAATRILDRFADVEKKSINLWTAKCPAHGGHGQSMKIAIQCQTGLLLVRCQRGCPIEKVLAAVYLAFPEDIILFLKRTEAADVINAACIAQETIPMHELEQAAHDLAHPEAD
jgi:hypothetical protein